MNLAYRVEYTAPLRKIALTSYVYLFWANKSEVLTKCKWTNKYCIKQ